MNENPLVSIILPTYNRANYIGKCIDTILGQTYTNWEIIIIDDSPLITHDALLPYLNDHRIHYLSNTPKAGLQESRNMGIKAARGEALFMVDDDILLHPECIENLVKTYRELAQKEDHFVIVPRLVDIRDQNTESAKKNVIVSINKWTGEIDYNYSSVHEGLPQISIGHANCFYTMSSVFGVNCYKEKLYKGTYAYEDIDLNMRLAHRGYKFYFQSNAVADHNRSDTGGCRVQGRVSQTYYYVRNYIAYLFANFGIKSVYMLPCFLCVFAKRVIVNNVFRGRKAGNQSVCDNSVSER